MDRKASSAAFKKLHTSQVLIARIKRRSRRFKLWARVIVASTLYSLKFVDLFRLLKKVLRQGRVEILCFHDVSETAAIRAEFSISVPPDAFGRFLDYLGREYRVVNLDKAVHLLASEQGLRGDVVALTFDDCYKGWIDHVYPECHRHGFPFTVFVTTDPLDSGRPTLYHSLILVGEKAKRQMVDLSRWGAGIYFLDSPEGLYGFVYALHEKWRGLKMEEWKGYLEEIAEYVRVDLDSDEWMKNLITWDELRYMDSRGVTVGAHGVSHADLRLLEDQVCCWEFSYSKKRLEQELGRSVDFFAYPYGTGGQDRCFMSEKLAEAGYRNGFMLNQGSKKRFKPFEIRRRSVSKGMFLGPDGKFHEALLATELCGLGDIVFGRVLTRNRRSGGE